MYSPEEWARLTPEERGPCNEWQKYRDRDGYGTIWYKGTTWRAHRAAWDEHVGPIPAGMHVLHHCDNPACVKVAHLFLGSHVENVGDMNRKGRQSMHAVGNRYHVKLTDEQVADIRARYVFRGHPNTLDLAAEYGVHPSHIGKIVHRQHRK